MVFEAGQQAYVNVLVPNPAQMTFTSFGGVPLRVFLLNYPVTNAVWETEPISNYVTYSQSALNPEVVANQTLTTSAGITASVSPILSPVDGYYIGGMAVYLTSNATLTAGTDLQVSLADSVSGQIAVINLSPANGIYSGILGLFWNNKSAASTLSLNLSTTLSAGKLYYTIPYGTSNFVG
jgi:hypothetical protein